MSYIKSVAYEVEFADEFGEWWENLPPEEQESIAFSVRLLEEEGINLKRPQADTIKGSAYPNMRELRCQHEGRPFRVLYIFDPHRVAILLIGGDKTGNKRWYKIFVPKADAIYAEHLREIKNK
jgi:hypothetical protein